MAEQTISLDEGTAQLAELAQKAREGADVIIMRDGDGHIALIDARRLDTYRRLERESARIALLDVAWTVLADMAAGRTLSLSHIRAKYRRR